MNKELFKTITDTSKCPRKLLFIGSGRTKTPKEWLSIPSIRVNARTLGYFPENDIYGILTWPAFIDDGLGGVLRSKRYQESIPYIFMFDLARSPDECILYSDEAKLFHIGTKNRFEWEAFKYYVSLMEKFGYKPRNSTGMYLILWLLYADVDEIYISGFDGHLALSGTIPGKWDTNTPYKDIQGNIWCPQDNKEIESGKKDFYYHNLYIEWQAIEDAVQKARDRGVKIFVSKECPNNEQ